MSGLGFLHPGLLAGLALAVVPVLIHLFDRRRLPRVVLPTLQFLARANEQTKRRIRLRDALLLALRVAAITGVVLMVAHPVWRTQAAPLTQGPALRSVVYVAETSFGMGYRLDGQTLIEIAKAKMADAMRTLRPGEEAAVAECGLGWRPVTRGFEVPETAAKALDSIVVGDGVARWDECLQGALALLTKSRNPAAEIRVFSNLAAPGWQTDALPLAPKGRSVRLTVIDVAGRDLPNRAITGLRLSRGYGHAGELWSATLDAMNFGPAVRGVGVRLLTDEGKLLAQGLVDWDGAGPASKTLQISSGSGYTYGRVIAAPDALPGDDERPFQFYFGKPLQVLILDGAPGVLAEESESYYLATALRPGRTGGSIDAKVITRIELQATDLQGVQVVFVLNAAEISEHTRALLEAFVRSGGGLFWAMGDKVSFETYARLGALLPGRFRSLRDLRKPGDEPARLKSYPAQHPMFRDIALGNLSSAQVYVYQQLESLPPTAKVLLEFADGSAALVESSLGKGRILWWASTLDAGWTNLPFRPFYLPLLQQATRYLGGTLQPNQQRTYSLGARVDLKPMLGTRKAQVRTPSGNVLLTEGLFTETSMAGLYRVELLGGTPLPEANFLVVRSPDASDLRRIEAAALQAKVRAAGYGGGVEGGSTSEARPFDPFLVVMGMLGLVLLAEARLACRRDG